MSMYNVLNGYFASKQNESEVGSDILLISDG